MLSLYKKIFNISYDSILIFEECIEDINLWDKTVRKYNNKINSEIFSFTKTQKKESQSFIYEAINFYINYHINSRSLMIHKNYSKSKFIFWAFCNHLKSFFIQLLEYFKNQITVYSNVNVNGNTSLAFGFPAHSFSFTEEIVYPSSLIEYLLSNNLHKKDMSLISMNEYVRKSKKENIKIKSLVNQYPRIIPNKYISIKNFLQLPFVLIKDILKYFKDYPFYNLGFLIYYLSQKSKTKSLENFIKKINIDRVEKIFLIDDLSISEHLIDTEISEKIYTFCYSQNYLDVNSNLIKEINTGSINNKIQVNILDDLNHNIFRHFRFKPINFNKQAYFFYNIRNHINQIFKLNLINTEISQPQLLESYSNLGFETIKNINLNAEYSILILDNTSESLEENFRHFILGNFSGLENFISEFNDDIISLSKMFKLNFYYKAKYGENIKSINNINKSIEKYKATITIIDSYSKIIINGNNKFDLMINLPYTSTNYTLSTISKESIYYIPSRYKINIKNQLSNLIVGKEELNKFIKKQYE